MVPLHNGILHSRKKELLPFTTAWNFLKKLKMELPFDPAIPLLVLYPKNLESSIQKNLCTPMFTASLFIIAEC